MTIRNHTGKREDGVVTIIVALSLAALIGCAGLALDLGRLYVNKTELQNAVDACALAAANELVCEPGSGACLENAEIAGIFAARQNRTNFQADNVELLPGDISFHAAVGPNGDYKTRAGGADPAARFAMCKADIQGMVPWFMGVLGVDAQSVSARAVATLAPGQTSCNAAPVGICSRGLPAPAFGRLPGDWITSAYTTSADSADLGGDFRWIDFTTGGGASPIRAQLLGNGAVCGIKSGAMLKRVTGSPAGALSAWNTRFGIYANGAASESYVTAAPDRTGYAYPSSALPTIIRDAFPDYRGKQAAHTPFTSGAYAVTGFGSATSNSHHTQYGAERRLVAVPVIDCGAPPANTPMLAMACVLMLNPMSNDASSTNVATLEWRGLAGAPASPCRSAGIAGGAGGVLVPTLVQ
jgi:hypothetical protein